MSPMKRMFMLTVTGTRMSCPRRSSIRGMVTRSSPAVEDGAGAGRRRRRRRAGRRARSGRSRVRRRGTWRRTALARVRGRLQAGHHEHVALDAARGRTRSRRRAGPPPLRAPPRVSWTSSTGVQWPVDRQAGGAGAAARDSRRAGPPRRGTRALPMTAGCDGDRACGVPGSGSFIFAQGGEGQVEFSGWDQGRGTRDEIVWM